MASNWQISRRTLLRGAGGVSLGLPFLDAMVRPGVARAATGPTRFVVFYTPGGTVRESWLPTGSEANFTLSPILKPLAEVQPFVTVLDGLDIKVTERGFGHPHTRGMAGILTGTPTSAGPYETCGGNAGFASGPSVDQVIANHISRNAKFKSLQMAVRWPSFSYGGVTVSPTNILNYEAADRPLPPETDPKAIWTRLFSDLGATDADLSARNRRSRSILDSVGASYADLAKRLGSADRQKLEAHLAKIRELEMSLGAGGPTGASCNPNFGTALDGPFSVASAVERCDGCVEKDNDVLIPKTGKMIMDLTVQALACDLTRVATVQWADLAANNSFPWLGLLDTHHGYQHDRGYQPDGIAKIDTWYAEQFAYFLKQLQATPDGDGTLLDNTVVFWCREISHPNTHSHVNMPLVLGGRAGGGLRSGRLLKFPNLPNNNLLVSFLNLFGVDSNTFGTPDYCSGALSGLS